jgi:hypothetical protein
VISIIDGKPLDREDDKVGSGGGEVGAILFTTNVDVRKW